MDWQEKEQYPEFEAFLRQFRPSTPKALPSRRRTVVALAVAATLMLAVVIPVRYWWTGPMSTPSAPARRDVRLTTAPNGVPQVDAMLAVYSPTEASERQVNVSLPAVQPRKALSAAPPQYPLEAQRLGLEGMVELRLTVDPAGE